MFEPSVAAGLMQALFDFAIAKGADAKKLAAESGFAPNRARAADDRLPFGDYVTLTRVAKRLAGNEALALHFGEQVEMAQFSVVGLLGPPPGSVEEVVRHFDRYVRLLVDVPGNPPQRLQLSRRGGALWLVDLRPDPNHFPELTESTFARMVSTCRRMGLQKPIAQLHVTHGKPRHYAEYGRLFDVPVRFDCNWNAVEFGDELLRLIPGGVQPGYMQTLAATHAEILLNRLGDQTTVTGRVAATIAGFLDNERRASAEMVAVELGVSRQTLYRRLKREGATFEQVGDEIRLRLAEADLERGKTIADVAHRLGYSDRAAFSKAFKRWAGVSPAARKPLARR